MRFGYESATQFSREYSRFFGQPPIRDVRAQLSAATSAEIASGGEEEGRDKHQEEKEDERGGVRVGRTVEARAHDVRAGGPGEDQAGEADAVGEAKRTQSEVAADEKGDDFDFATEGEANHEASESAEWAGGAGCEKRDAESGLAEECGTNPRGEEAVEEVAGASTAKEHGYADDGSGVGGGLRGSAAVAKHGGKMKLYGWRSAYAIFDVGVFSASRGSGRLL